MRKCLRFVAIEVPVPRHGLVTCKAKLLYTVCDLPAKAAIMNCNQWNGQFGCPSCKREGEQVCIQSLLS